ncbi:MAG: MFS transporter [Cyanobacteria bacterium P01_G01_bin.38]
MKSISNPQPISQPREGSRDRGIALAAMCLALFMATLDDTVMNVALPQIQLSFAAPVSGLQWILNAYILPIACLVLPSGTLGDIYGRRRVFLVGLILFTLASLLSGVAINLPMLIGGRILQGIGAAALIPGSLAIVAEMFPEPKEQAKAIGFWTAVSGLALLAGPVLGGFLVDTLGWQSVFLLNLPLGMITFGLTLRFVRLSTQPTHQRLDLLGMALSVVLLASLASALTEGGQQSLWLLAIAGLSLVAFLAVESRVRHPMVPLNLFKDATFSVVSIVNTLLFFTLVSSLFIFSLFLQQIQGFSASEAGMRFLPLNATFVLASLLSGWLAARLGLRFTIAAGLILAGAATLSFVHIRPDTEYSQIAWKLMLSGFGGGLTLSPLASAAMTVTSASKAGLTAAILNTTTRLGGVLGIALQGTLLTQQLASGLGQKLSEWNLSPQLQDQIVADALHNVAEVNMAEVAQALPENVPLEAIHQAIQASFVSGLHMAAMVGGLVLLVGAALILWVASPTALKVSR